jgi:hypothetical protein
MPSSARKGTRHFETLWTFFFSGHISPTITSDLLHDVESELQRDLLARCTLPPYITSAELKYKLSDLEAALKTKPICTDAILAGEDRLQQNVPPPWDFAPIS